MGLKDTSTGDTLSDSGKPVHPGVDDLPRAGHQRRDRAERPRATRTSWASRSSGWPRRTRPSRSGPTRRPAGLSSPGWRELHLEVLVERMRREFKVEANIRPAAGRLPRRPSARRSSRSTTPTRSRPAAPASSRGWSSTSGRPAATAAATSSRTRSPAAPRYRGVHPVGGRRMPGSRGVRRAGGLPDGGPQGHPDRRCLPRGGLF